MDFSKETLEKIRKDIKDFNDSVEYGDPTLFPDKTKDFETNFNKLVSILTGSLTPGNPSDLSTNNSKFNTELFNKWYTYFYIEFTKPGSLNKSSECYQLYMKAIENYKDVVTIKDFSKRLRQTLTYLDRHYVKYHALDDLSTIADEIIRKRS